MSLHARITLSKKHQRHFAVFPCFFTHALNHFYFLTEECGFRKPRLDTWKDEGIVEFLSKDIRVCIQYEYPAWVTVCLERIGVPKRVYERDLFDALEIPFDESSLRPSHEAYSPDPERQRQEIESDIERTVHYLSMLIRDNLERIFSYLKDT